MYPDHRRTGRCISDLRPHVQAWLKSVESTGRKFPQYRKTVQVPVLVLLLPTTETSGWNPQTDTEPNQRRLSLQINLIGDQFTYLSVTLSNVLSTW